MTVARKNAFLMGVVVLTSMACGQVDSESKGIGQILNFKSNKTDIRLGNKQPEILVYYANETNNTSDKLRRHFTTIDDITLGLKQQTGEELYARIANTYGNDLRKFLPQVEKEVALLEKAICDGGRVDQGLLVFTNKLAKDGLYRGCLPKDNGNGQQKMTRVSGKLDVALPASVADDFRFTEFRLGTTYGLQAAMKVVSKAMAGKNFRAVLITKSHGDYARVLVPKLTHDMDHISRADMQRYFEDVVAAASFTQQPFVALKVGDMKIGDMKIGDLKVADLKIGDLKLGDLKVADLKTGDLKIGDLKVADLKVGDLKVADLKVGDLKLGDLKVGDLKVGDLKVADLKTSDLKVGDMKVGDLKVSDLKVGDLKTGDLASDNTENLANKPQLGIKKSDFIDILRASTMKFSLVFLESCNSQLTDADALDLAFDSAMDDFTKQQFIDAVVASDAKGLSYESIDYAAITPELRQGQISEVLQAALARKQAQEQAK